MFKFLKHESMRLMALGLFIFALSTPVTAENIQIFDTSFHRISLDSETSPPDFTNSPTTNLPNNARVSASTSAWYQINFNLEQKPTLNLSIFLPLVNMNASLYLNGQLVSASGSFTEPMSRFWHTPILFHLPINNLNQGNNTISIRLKASQPNDLTQLGKVYLGNNEMIYGIYAKEYFASYTIHLMSISAALFLSFITLYLWSIRRLDEYIYFSLASLAWAISSFNIVIHNPPISSFAWEWLIHSSLSWMSPFLLVFMRRVVGIQASRCETIIWGINIAFTLILLMTPNIYFFAVANAWHLIALITAAFAVFLVIRSFYKHRNRTTLILSSGFLMVILFAIHDFLIVVNILSPENRFLLDYSMPVLFLAIAIVLIHRFVDVSKGLEHANATLEQRVLDAEQEIKESYEIISAMAAAKAVDKERTRIFGDLHDDLGAKLLSLVYKSETVEQKTLAKQAMEGLREIVKRSPVEERKKQLNPIATWFSECQKRCTEHHIPFEWHQHRIPESYTPSLELTNVLREAMSNAIKHGDGKKICVRVQIRFGLFIMSVCNTGKSFSEDTPQGSGRKNMRMRIATLKGNIRWRGGKLGGCHVIWTIPLGKNNDQ